MFGGLKFNTREQLLSTVTRAMLISVLLLGIAHVIWYGVRSTIRSPQLQKKSRDLLVGLSMPNRWLQQSSLPA